MKKANSFRTYGRTVQPRNTAASITFDEIMKKKDMKENSPFATSDSSTGCKDEIVPSRPRRRFSHRKRVIMPIEVDSSREERSPAPNSNFLNVSFNSDCHVVLTPLEKRQKMCVLKSQDGNVEQEKKTTVKREKRKKAVKHNVQDKENSANEKAFNFADIEQDSLIIESDQPVQMAPQSSTPNSVRSLKSTSRIPNLEKHEMDMSNIKSNCEDLHHSFDIVESPSESRYPSPTQHITLRRSARKAKGRDPNLWESLMKKSYENVQIINDDVDIINSPAATDSIDEYEVNQSSSLFDTTEEEEATDSDEDLSSSFKESPVSILYCISEESEDEVHLSMQKLEEETESSSIEDSTSSYKSAEKSFYEHLIGSSMQEGGEESAEERLLDLCDQTDFITFSKCIPPRMMSECVKIGEGVYGEVFRSVSHGHGVAIKIVPMEGDFEVNDCPQKLFEEVLPEVVIAKELSDLALGASNKSGNFCQVNRISCVQDTFPDHLLHQWDEYTKKKRSENDRPDMFPEDQRFIVFEFGDGGAALENFKFSNHTQAFSALRQVVYALAVAESALEFEHRDLHIGNVLVRKCKEETISFCLDDCEMVFPSEGVFATIIDFTISRLKKDGCAVFCDVSTDDGLFEGKGDIQFDVYRNMKQENNNEWSKFCPHSNILWVHYLCEKLNTVIKYKDSGRGHRDAQRKLRSLSSTILDFNSCQELCADLSLWVL